jgi:hypothetical protein
MQQQPAPLPSEQPTIRRPHPRPPFGAYGDPEIQARLVINSNW